MASTVANVLAIWTILVKAADQNHIWMHAIVQYFYVLWRKVLIIVKNALNSPVIKIKVYRIYLRTYSSLKSNQFFAPTFLNFIKMYLPFTFSPES